MIKVKFSYSKLFVLLFSLFFLSSTSFAQFVQIPISKVYSQKVKGNRCMDSTWTISNTCRLEQSKFAVTFYNVFLDKKQKSVRLVGRVTGSDNKQSAGLTGIEIIKGKKFNNVITDRSYVGETTDGKKFISNDGFFDITFQVANGESLFFYGYQYFIEEFKVSNLLTQ